MTINVIVSRLEFSHAARLLLAVACYQKLNDNRPIVMVCDPISSTITLKSALAEEIWGFARLEAAFNDDVFEHFWVELSASFLTTLLSKRRQGQHVKLEIDTTRNQMKLLQGNSLSNRFKNSGTTDQLFPQEEFVEIKDNATYLQNFRTLNSLADYDLPEAPESQIELELTKADCKLIHHSHEFNSAQLASSTDHVSLDISDSGTCINSTNFFSTLSPRTESCRQSLVLNTNALRALNESLQAIRIYPDDKVFLSTSDSSLVLKTARAVVNIRTKPLSERPYNTPLPSLSEPLIPMLVSDCKQVLKELDAKQKKNEDFVMISVTEDNEYLEFSSETENGFLSSTATVYDNDSIELDDMRVFRAPFLAALSMFFDENTVNLMGFKRDSDELFITNELRTRYVVLQKFSVLETEDA